MASTFFGFFFSSKKTIESIQEKLRSLKVKMRSIERMENKVEAIISLFQVISPIQDAGGFDKEISELKKHNRKGKNNRQIKALESLQLHFRNAGRSQYGFNRTTKGEEITANKIYLGDVLGLDTKKADYWLSKKSDLEKTFRPDVSKDYLKPVSEWYIINDYQCGNFVKSHTDGILKEIKELEVA